MEKFDRYIAPVIDGELGFGAPLSDTNTAVKLNSLLVKILMSTGQLVSAMINWS